MAKLYLKIREKAMVVTLGAVSSCFLFSAAFAAVPSDPNYLDQSKMYQQINAERAWDITTGSKKVVVAFIDTGFDIWHDDIRENIWINPHEIADNGRDDDLNGFIDDINGWNFVENNNTVRPSVFESTDDKEAVSHGTLVGGLVGAKGNNGLWGTGLAQNVSIMALRAIESTGSGSASAVSKAIDYAVDNGANIISISFMGEKSDQKIYNALREAYEKGITIVVSAGNFDKDTENGDMGKRPIYPACFDMDDGLGENWILAVGSVDEKDQLSDFSEYGKCLDVVAPGEYIYSTERYAPQYGYNSQFGGPWFGTSFSAPLATGLAALIKSIHPEFSPKEVIQLILNTADSIESKNPELAGLTGSGRINAGRALEVAYGSPLRRGNGSIWYFSNRELWRFDTALEKSKQVTELPSGSLISFTAYSSFLNDEVVVLTKRNHSYYLDIHAEDGSARGSIIVPNSAFISENIIIRFSGSSYYLLSRKNNLKGGTDFRVYNTQSKKISNKTITDRIITADIGEDGEVYYTTLKKGILNLVGLSSKKVIYNLRDVAKVYDLKVVDGRVVMLVSKGSRVLLVSVPLVDGEIYSKLVGKNIKNSWSIKILQFADQTYLLPNAPEQGKYVMYNSSLIESLTFVKPALPSTAK